MGTKEKLLALLEDNKGGFLSGEAMARALGVSRNAVWKGIKALKENGYKINAVRNKGYSLDSVNDILSVQAMKPYLAHDIGADKIHIYDELASTNVTAKQMALSEKDAHGSVIIAKSQTDGRGRRGRSFFSPEGGIYISFIIKPQEMYEKENDTFTITAAVAACEAIESVTDLRPGIKWINDIFLDGRKVCGILTESAFDMESRCLDWVVIGIGINYHIPLSDMPDDIRKSAGSLFTEGNPEVSRSRLTAELINKVYSFFIKGEKGRKEILSSYRKRLNMLGKEVEVFFAGKSFKALAEDINDCGNLIIKKDDGTRQVLSSGEISVRWAKHSIL